MTVGKPDEKTLWERPNPKNKKGELSKMRRERRTLSSILAFMLCLSLIVGATYALFTSKDTTNIAITSGNVEVVATIENLEVYSPTLIWEDGTVKDKTNAASNGVFVNGGTASLEEAKLTLDKMSPGDKATFQIKITNNSNIDILYRTVIMTMDDNGLFEGLNVTIGEIYDGSTKYSAWTPLSSDEKEIVLNCSVELPTKAGEEYRSKSCSIVFAVEAVQGNTATTNAVAKIGETEFATLEGAISALQAGQTLEIIRPGTYEPFTIGVNNVTVKGIVGETKAESTVIKNTATDKIILGSGTIADDSNPTLDEIRKLKGVDGVTLENLWIDSTTVSGLGSWDTNMAIITTPYYENVSSSATNLTVTGCYIEGEASQNVLMGFGDGLKFTNNTVKNFDTAFYAETSLIKSQLISGNTFEGVKTAVAYVMSGGQADVTITNNTVVDSTVFTIWDYAQWSTRNSEESVSGFANFTVSGNNGTINYNLTHMNYKVATPGSVTLGTGEQRINYINAVAFDIPFADAANYTITNVDGSALDRTTQGRSNLHTSKGGYILVDGVEKAACYELAAGEYMLVNNVTGEKYLFTVTNPNAGTQQYIKLDTLAITSAEDMVAFANDVNNNGNEYYGKTVVLLNDIDMSGIDWAPVGQTGAKTFHGVFNGNEHTISNLTVNTAASGGLFGWIEEHTSSVQILNTNLVDATIVGGDYAGGLVGYIGGAGAANVISGCSVSGSTISANKSAGAIVGHIASALNISEVSSTGNEINGILEGREWGVGAIFGRSNGGTVTTMTDVEISGNTLSQPEAKDAQTSEYYGKSYGTTTLDGTAISGN